jgi:sodium/potassium-transporting ATPase subunit alpha
VIGFCMHTFTAEPDTQFDLEQKNYPMKDFCFLGMAAIMDPPRDDAAIAIEACKHAGIKVCVCVIM